MTTLTTQRTAARRGRGPRARGGFTLVETLMAVTLLSIGLLALASLAVAAGRSVAGGSRQTLAASVAQARFDSLASVPCQPLLNAGTTSGASSTRRIRETWKVTAQGMGGTMNSLLLEVTLTVPGRAGALSYKSVIPCRRTV
jgi:type IV pilus assembly protein PilV